MGLFGFIGKAIKGVAKVAVGAAKLGLGSGLIPGGGLAGKALGVLLGAKRPMGGGMSKLPLARSPVLMRGHAPSSRPGVGGWERASPQILRRSPVMPGGAIATPGGMRASSGGAPPTSYAGSSSRAAPGARRCKPGKRRAVGKGKRKKARRLKFGSPAWRKKYMKRR